MWSIKLIMGLQSITIYGLYGLCNVKRPILFSLLMIGQ